MARDQSQTDRKGLWGNPAAQEQVLRLWAFVVRKAKVLKCSQRREFVGYNMRTTLEVRFYFKAKMYGLFVLGRERARMVFRVTSQGF